MSRALFALLVLAAACADTAEANVGLHGALQVESRSEVAAESHSGIHGAVDDHKAAPTEEERISEGAVNEGSKANDNTEMEVSPLADAESKTEAEMASGAKETNKREGGMTAEQIHAEQALAKAKDFKKQYEKAKETEQAQEALDKAKWEKQRLDRSAHREKYDVPTDRIAGDDAATTQRIHFAEREGSLIDPASNPSWGDHAAIQEGGMPEEDTDLGESLGESDTEMVYLDTETNQQVGAMQSRMYDILGLMEHSHVTHIDKSRLSHQKEVHSFDAALRKHERRQARDPHERAVQNREEYEDSKEDSTMDNARGNKEYQGLSAMANPDIGGVHDFGHLLMYHEEEEEEAA